MIKGISTEEVLLLTAKSVKLKVLTQFT